MSFAQALLSAEMRSWLLAAGAPAANNNPFEPPCEKIGCATAVV